MILKCISKRAYGTPFFWNIAIPLNSQTRHAQKNAIPEYNQIFSTSLLGNWTDIWVDFVVVGYLSTSCDEHYKDGHRNSYGLYIPIWYYDKSLITIKKDSATAVVTIDLLNHVVGVAYPVPLICIFRVIYPGIFLKNISSFWSWIFNFLSLNWFVSF